MPEDAVLTALLNLSGTSALVYVLYKLLEKVLGQQAAEYKASAEAAQKESERRAAEYKDTTAMLVTVITDNGEALRQSAVANARVEKTLETFPALVNTVLGRLDASEAETEAQGERISELERGEPASKPTRRSKR